MGGVKNVSAASSFPDLALVRGSGAIRQMLLYCSQNRPAVNVRQWSPRPGKDLYPVTTIADISSPSPFIAENKADCIPNWVVPENKADSNPKWFLQIPDAQRRV